MHNFQKISNGINAEKQERQPRVKTPEVIIFLQI